MDAGRLPRRRGVLRHQRLPHHAPADRGAHSQLHHLAAHLLDAPRPSAAPRAVHAARRRVGRRAALLPRGGPQPGGAGLVGAVLRHQLVLHHLRPVVLRPRRTAAGLPAPLVAGDRGAVLPPLADHALGAAEAVRQPPPGDGARHLRRRRPLPDLDVHPVRAGNGSQPRLLRHGHQGLRAADGRRVGPAVAAVPVVDGRPTTQAARAGPDGRGCPGRARTVFPADGGVQPIPVQRRLCRRVGRHAPGDHDGGAPGHRARPVRAGPADPPVDRRPFVLAVPVALADLRVHPTGPRPAAGSLPHAHPAAGADGDRRRSQLPVRRGADPQRRVPALAPAPRPARRGSPADRPDRPRLRRRPPAGRRQHRRCRRVTQPTAARQPGRRSTTGRGRRRIGGPGSSGAPGCRCNDRCGHDRRCASRTRVDHRSSLRLRRQHRRPPLPRRRPWPAHLPRRPAP